MSSQLLRTLTKTAAPLLLHRPPVALQTLSAAPATFAARAASTSSSEGGTPEITFLRRLVHKMSGFNQYGLYHDDCLAEHDDVKEAIRRLPEKIQDERNFRMIRAMQCSIQKTVLPKEQWPTIEEDLQKGRYLQPYLEEVRREFAEKERWGKL